MERTKNMVNFVAERKKWCVLGHLGFLSHDANMGYDIVGDREVF